MLRLVILKKAQMLLRVFGKCLTRLSVSKQTNNYDGRVVVRRTDRYSTGALPSNPQHTIISDTMLPNSYQHIIFQSFLCYPGHELIFSTTDFRIYNCHTKSMHCKQNDGSDIFHRNVIGTKTQNPSICFRLSNCERLQNTYNFPYEADI